MFEFATIPSFVEVISPSIKIVEQNVAKKKI